MDARLARRSLIRAFDDLAANMADVICPGACAYAEQFCSDHPDHDWDLAVADAVAATGLFLAALTGP
jgi:hypothetical protein